MNARGMMSSVVDPTAQVGEGTVLGEFCVIGANVVIGSGCRIGHHVVIHEIGRAHV